MLVYAQYSAAGASSANPQLTQLSAKAPLQQKLNITIWVITISGGNNNLPSVLVSFCSVFNDIPFITIIVRFCGPKVRIYDRYCYIYAGLY